MEQQLTDLEYSNTDATVEQVKAAIRAAKVQASQRIPCISDGSAVCLHDGDGRACAFDCAAAHDAGGV